MEILSELSKNKKIEVPKEFYDEMMTKSKDELFRLIVALSFEVQEFKKREEANANKIVVAG